ncbi:MAG: hypothetical protein Q7R59_02445 [bacterium]|nr:hypothetical protein [bacterium]
MSKLTVAHRERSSARFKILEQGTKISVAPVVRKDQILVRYSKKIPLNEMAKGRNRFITSRTYVRRGKMISELWISRLAAEHLHIMLGIVLSKDKK